MDVSSAAWFSELEMEESDFKNHHQIIDNKSPLFQSCYMEGDHVSKQSMSNKAHDPFAPNLVSSSNTSIMCFGNPNQSPELNPYQLVYDGSNIKFSGTSRNIIQSRDNILSERKRRELLNQRLLSLSSLLPNLKKMDKASVLEDAIVHIKQLQTRMKELEEATVQGTKLKEVSVVSIRRSNICDGSNIIDDNNKAEIEVRISESSVLVRIYSHKDYSIVKRILSEMERLNLTINSSSVVPFSSTALLITMCAQMSEGCVVTAMDVVNSLQSTLTNFRTILD